MHPGNVLYSKQPLKQLSIATSVFIALYFESDKLRLLCLSLQWSLIGNFTFILSVLSKMNSLLHLYLPQVSKYTVLRF